MQDVMKTINHDKYYKEKLAAIILTFSLLLPTFLQAQERMDTLTFRIMEYNVENLFDYTDDSLTNDEDFLPHATRHWTRYRYYNKLDNIARVIITVGEWNPPALVALCEIENDSVLYDLTHRSLLREADYRYITTHSADIRGIDVALLYQRHLFKPLTQQSLSVKKPHKTSRPTRDILHVSGKLLNGDTLDVFVAHFPSRSEGRKKTEPYRIAAAQCAKEAIDSICLIRQHPQVILLGDLNDYPNNHSIRKTLQAQAPDEKGLYHPHRLYHLLARKAQSDKLFGSYKYQGRWGLLDHIIVSGNLLLTNSRLHTTAAKTDVFYTPFLLTEDKKNGGLQPFRTYHGMKYIGGFSDHLPIYAEFTLVY